MPNTPHSTFTVPLGMHPNLGFSQARGGGATGSAAAEIEADRTDSYVVLGPSGVWASDDVVDQIDSSAWSGFGILSRRFGSPTVPTNAEFTVPDDLDGAFVIYNADGEIFFDVDTDNGDERVVVGSSAYSASRTVLRHGSSGYVSIEGASSADIRLQISGSSFILGTGTNRAPQVPQLTTAQRTALTATDGMIVYDTDLTAFYFREGGAWVTK